MSSSIFRYKLSKQVLYFPLALSIVFSCALAHPALSYAQISDRIGKKPAETPEEAEFAKEGTTEINVKNADIAAIVRIFSKRTKRNYILDENVKGKVSIYLPGKVSETESLKILDSTLAMKGFTSVPIGDNLWKIVPLKDAKQSTIPTRLDEPTGSTTAAVVTRLLALKYVNADEIKQLIAPLISGEGLVNAYTGTNSLIIIDSEDNIQRIGSIVSALDVPSTDRDMSIIPVKNADAKEIADKLNEILGSGSGKSKSSESGLDLLRDRIRESALTFSQGNRPPGSTNTSGISALNVAGGRTVSARAREPNIIADDRTNSIIVVADEETSARIKALVSQLDSKVDLSGSKFYVYRCQHASAVDLAEVLSGIVGGGSGSTSSSSRSSFGGLGSDDSSSGGSLLGSRSRNSRSSSSRTSRGQDRLSSQQRNLGQGRSSSPSGNRSGSAVAVGEDLSITADPSTNSLVIMASKQDYTKILELLQKLDVKRRQVLVEAMLLEVGLTDGVSEGTDWVSSTGGKDGGILVGNNAGNLVNLLSDPQKLSGFSVAAASAGSLKLPGLTIPTQSVLLSAAQANSNVNVLSAPTILATDNEEAEIVVGQNVPFVSSQATSDTNLNNTFNQVDRQDVGITLRLTPQINSEDSVTLKIFTEVSNVIEATLTSNLGPTTTIRTSETTAITKDSQMIVIGGLMADNVSETTSGVPFFKDIPVLGHLFKESKEDRRRTNLLIFITPRIVRDQFDARDATITKRDSLQGDIDSNKIFPRRDEVLQSPSIDKVAELSPFNGDKPSTITGPSTRSSSPKVTGKADSSTDNVIHLRVMPKIPEVHNGEQAVLNTQPASKQVNSTGEQYLVLQLGKSSKSAKAALPFAISSSDGTFGVIVPADSPALAKNFFEAGVSYIYEMDGTKYAIQAQGLYSSSGDAESLHPSIGGNWYTLSPYEIMNIGTGPWLRQK